MEDTQQPGKRLLPALSPRAYEHPADRAALSALRSVPGFDRMVRRVFGGVGDRALRLAFLASAVRVGPRQLKPIYDRHLEACAVLDIHPAPELYVAQAPFFKAGAVGVDKPFVVLDSGALALLDLEELQFLLGHELGHVLAGHALYKTMLQLLLRTSSLALAFPLGGPAVFAVAAALLEWDRCSELSADRAGLLVVQSPEIAQRVTMKIAGGSSELDVEEFVRQADEYQSGGAVVDSVMKLLRLMGESHPFAVLRLAELRKWTRTGGYGEILDGRYAPRDAPPPGVVADVKAASRAYRDDFSTTQDALLTAVRGVGARAQTFGRSVLDALRRRRPEPAPAAAARTRRGGPASKKRRRPRRPSKRD